MQLNDVLNFEEPIYAHICEGKNAETLQQHTKLCQKYYKKLMDTKMLKLILGRFLQRYMENCTKEAELFFWEMLEGSIIFHDTGKINPAFQRERMKKPFKYQKDFQILEGSKHSLLSSVIYLDYCYYLLAQMTMSIDEKRKLKSLIYVNAYIISRHHDDLGAMREYGEKFLEGGQIYEMISRLPNEKQTLYKGPFHFNQENIGTVCKAFPGGGKKRESREDDRKGGMELYIYARLLYSLLTSADYYATTEYMNGFAINQFGEVNQVDELRRVYEACGVLKSIREYEKTNVGTKFVAENEINALRCQLFLEAEAEWKVHKEENVFFLEAPTGSGKSNTAMNLSFQMLKAGQTKLCYVYPFNTLVEQNLDSIKRIFGGNEDIMSMVTVVNSVTPIKIDEDKKKAMSENNSEFYQSALLDRQFLNYPFILTTHVGLFETLFSNKREALFGFLQMAGSVIVLDEIQSYKNTLWSEIIIFLKAFAEFMNMKVLIMSATLPDLEYLTEESGQVVRLMKRRDQYFLNPVFRERVQLSYEMLKEKTDFEQLHHHICDHVQQEKKVLVEFIKKKSAYEFYEYACEYGILGMELRLLTGDDNRLDREKILNEIRCSDKGVILIATQVVEAGVDIDMDIGYKDISKLDSEEQFLGRINRSCKKGGVTYFFDLDNAGDIYKDDFRINRELTLENEEMREALKNKQFAEYYLSVINLLKESRNKSASEEGLEHFFKEVKHGNFKEIAAHMHLIEENSWTMSVYLSRMIELPDGTQLDGEVCWEEYKKLLLNQELPYAKKQVLLSKVRSQMNYFIYEIKNLI
ncbi:MAG: CRISPR-associated helicase Cas3' [Hungatella hathewayi]